jgi:hypothetical protein
MKSGDLVQISDPQGTYVVNISTGYAMPLYPEGTPAIVLGLHEVPDLRGERKILVLIDGIQGWVYESELELLHGEELSDA